MGEHLNPNQTMNKKRILFSIFLTFLVNVLAIPLWTKCGYSSFVQTLFNKEARLEFVYTGAVTGDEPFHFQSTPKPFYSSWYYGREDDAHRACADLCYKAGGKWQKLSFLLNARHDGEVKMLIKGSSTQDEYGNNYPILTDWRNIKINGEVISNTSGTVSNEKPFCKRFLIKKGELLRIEAEFRKHRFTIQDFIFLEHGGFWFLITGSLLIFFLIYRLLSCWAECRERLRPSDALLLVIFFPCLFLPMINISDAVKSVRENRMLAIKPKLEEILRGEINTGGGMKNGLMTISVDELL